MNLVDRAKNIIISPEKEWDVIATETPEQNSIFSKYLIPLIGLAAIAVFIGVGVIGSGMGGNMNVGLYLGVLVFFTYLWSVYFTAWVLDMLAPSFEAKKDFGRSFQVIAYAFTPLYVGGMLAIVPAIAIVGVLFSLYSLYLLYLGMKKLKQAPPDKQMSFFVVTLVVSIVIYLLSSIVLQKIFSSFWHVTAGGVGI